jgi:hypothetical protein
MTLDAIEFIRRFLLHLCAPAAEPSALLTDQQKSALSRSCPQCKCGTLHVVARYSAVEPSNPNSALHGTTFDSPEETMRFVCQPGSSLQRLLTPPSLPYVSHRLRTGHDSHPAAQSGSQPQRQPG